jgi:hypothetical protein
MSISRRSFLLIAIAAALLVTAPAVPAAAQTCSPSFAVDTTSVRVDLYSAVGEGFASFRVEEYGGASDIKLHPTGYENLVDTGGRNYILLFERGVSNPTRQALGEQWAYFHSCGLTLMNDVQTHISAARDVLTDVLIGTSVRITHFVLPEFPGLEIRLHQEVCGNELTQIYTFHNTRGSDIHLAAVRVADLDVVGYWANKGEEYPSGAGNSAYGVTTWWKGEKIGTTLTAPAVGDAIFEGWRVHAGNSGSTVLAKASNSWGFANTPWPGANGDGLNGIWRNTSSHTSFVPACGGNVSFTRPEWCEPSAADTPNAASGLSTRGDIGVLLQWDLTVPAGGSATLETGTVSVPGDSTCEPWCSKVALEAYVGTLGLPGSSENALLAKIKHLSCPPSPASPTGPFQSYCTTVANNPHLTDVERISLDAFGECMCGTPCP